MKSLFLILMLAFTLNAAEDLWASPEIKYERKYFRHWTDFDGDKQRTRTEILIRDNLNEDILFKTNKEIDVYYGLWYCHYTGTFKTNSNMIDIEHVVSLKDAWVSGAWSWSPEKRERYANDLTYKWLLPVDKYQNRSKGSKPPHLWLPQNKKFHIAYCMIWIEIKNRWGLTVTESELNFLKIKLFKIKNIIYPKVRYGK